MRIKKETTNTILFVVYLGVTVSIGFIVSACFEIVSGIFIYLNIDFSKLFSSLNRQIFLHS